ncbi:hypothetical protein KAI87_08375 [Myxococcota bacterium]|nr:hypothetical protein [Myxococcota bacterium]
MKNIISLLTFALVFSFATPSRANDGRDRYQKGYPNLFTHLYAPISDGAGYRVLAEDMEGGADGDPAYRWAQSHTLALVEVAARRTFETFGKGAYPMAVFDLASENGDTPIGFGEKTKSGKWTAPRGRHPGGSHDGGLNLDLGYYLTSLKGLVEKEDYAACTDHYKKDEAGELKDQYMCTGEAERLDVDRQSYFLLELLKQHRDVFGGSLLGEVGIDKEVKDKVRARLAKWLKAKKYGVTKTHLTDFETNFTHDRWGGWQRFHHHHIHLRIQDFETGGPLRPKVAGLEKEARRIRALLAGQQDKTKKAVLDGQLLSYRSERAVMMHVLPQNGGVIKKVEFKETDGSWKPADDPIDDHRYTIDMPVGLRKTDGKYEATARVFYTDGKSEEISAKIHLPKQDVRLKSAYVPGTITSKMKVRGNKISLSLNYPETLEKLLTKVSYYLYPADGSEPIVQDVYGNWFAEKKTDKKAVKKGTKKKVRAGKGLPFTIKHKGGLKDIALVEARAYLSGRYAIRVPIAIQTP